MRLHRYGIDFHYVEGSKLHVADTLSRAVVADKACHNIPDMKINVVSRMTGISEIQDGRHEIQFLTFLLHDFKKVIRLKEQRMC